MKKFVLALMFMSTLAQAEEVFDASKNFTKQSTITWVYADNVAEACNAERKRYGLPTFKQPSAACSFWTDNNTCYIITKRNYTHDDIGHEVHHCFAGKFH